jgi:hypothetical protein
MAALATDLGNVLGQLAMLAAELAEWRILRHIAFASGVGAFFWRAHGFSMSRVLVEPLYRKTPAAAARVRL